MNKINWSIDLSGTLVAKPPFPLENAKDGVPENPLPKNASEIAEQGGLDYYAAFAFENTVTYLTADKETSIRFELKNGCPVEVLWIPGDYLEQIIIKLAVEGVETEKEAEDCLSKTVAPEISLRLFRKYHQFFYWLKK